MQSEISNCNGDDARVDSQPCTSYRHEADKFRAPVSEPVMLEGQSYREYISDGGARKEGDCRGGQIPKGKIANKRPEDAYVHEQRTSGSGSITEGFLDKCTHDWG